MAWLYGFHIRDEENDELLSRLRRRGTIESVFAADTVKRRASRHATAETAAQARAAIVRELEEWSDLDEDAPTLAAVRDHLCKPEAVQT